MGQSGCGRWETAKLSAAPAPALVPALPLLLLLLPLLLLRLLLLPPLSLPLLLPLLLPPLSLLLLLPLPPLAMLPQVRSGRCMRSWQLGHPPLQLQRSPPLHQHLW